MRTNVEIGIQLTKDLSKIKTKPDINRIQTQLLIEVLIDIRDDISSLTILLRELAVRLGKTY